MVGRSGSWATRASPVTGAVPVGEALKPRDAVRRLDGVLLEHIQSSKPFHVDGTLALDAGRIKTVSDLIAFMREKQLKFAPAVCGDESAYLALRRALASCDMGAQATTGANAGDL